MRLFAHLSLAFLACCSGLLPLQAHAQDNPPAQETVQIAVSTDQVVIGTNFAGIDFVVFGVLENSDTLVRLERRYDIIVTMEGTTATMVMRQKKRRAGMWINADSLTFPSVPVYYALTSTGELRDITTRDTYRRLGLGLDNLLLRADTPDADKAAAFRAELVRLKERQNLYSEWTGKITYGAPTLFRAPFRLPANIPTGQYTITAYLFRDGVFLNQASTRLEIRKEHLAYTIVRTARRHSFWYGMAAVLLAILTGFAGRLLWRRD
ncbi:MAG: Putative transmembrane protein [Candidatus Tokpelaia hoelldobleri]|uniref:Transmembrane protein n=1 Tax=Candidatus Tokpelaia hoelldobleri TaxID=1902579 RepID=A0A1U9JSK5_9HYPH|nr:MAG: Putative transmembrane protein [Candidatus Tokpelaia hoelldoblerii]